MPYDESQCPRWVKLFVLLCAGDYRGRDASYLAPPAQIRTGPIRAYGSHLGCLTAKRLSLLQLAVCAPAPVTRFPGTVPGPCFADSHSPRPPPLAPPTPQPVARPCSSASQLLWRGQTSHDRTSSATAPRLPDTDQRYTHVALADHEISRFPSKERPHMPVSTTTPGRLGARTI